MQFNAVIEKDENGYFAYVPGLKGCMSQGDTFEDAMKNIKEAIELFIEDLQSDELVQALSKNYIIAPIEVEPPHAG